jgi:NDP-sugar pyrophosphorylase family protein
MNNMQAVVLAGGKGVRLRPYTTNIPKPLVPIGDEYAILEIVLRQLARYGFKKATIAIGHLGTLIRAYVQDGSQFGLEVDYHEEPVPLGTIGPLLTLLDKLPEHFLLMNGDILTDLNYADLLRHHVDVGAPLTVGTYKRDVKIDFGVLEEVDGRIVHFVEKPTLYYSVSMGIYGLSRKTLEHYPKNQPFGFDELVLDLLSKGNNPATFEWNGYWFDIGRPDDYDAANTAFEQLKDVLLPDELERRR